MKQHITEDSLISLHKHRKNILKINKLKKPHRIESYVVSVKCEETEIVESTPTG